MVKEVDTASTRGRVGVWLLDLAVLQIQLDRARLPIAFLSPLFDGLEGKLSLTQVSEEVTQVGEGDDFSRLTVRPSTSRQEMGF